MIQFVFGRFLRPKKQNLSMKLLTSNPKKKKSLTRVQISIDQQSTVTTKIFVESNCIHSHKPTANEVKQMYTTYSYAY